MIEQKPNSTNNSKAENQAHFVYLCWSTENRNKRLIYSEDPLASVEVSTSVGPYKNNFADFVLERNNKYYWEIRIFKGNHFKIGVMK